MAAQLPALLSLYFNVWRAAKSHFIASPQRNKKASLPNVKKLALGERTAFARRLFSDCFRPLRQLLKLRIEGQ